MSDGYLSDDREMQLRLAAPAPCRDCRRYTVRESWVVESIQEGCSVVNEDVPNGNVVATLMLRIAKLEGACPSKEPFAID